MADTATQVRECVQLLRGWGYKVIMVDGWEHRGDDLMTTTGRVEHHTASPYGSSATASLRVVTFGRAGLRNSLCRWYVSRPGVIYLVALRESWHAGRGIKGSNRTLSGTEAEHSGDPREPWTAASLDAQAAISRAEAHVFGFDPSERVWDHKEHAPSRKVDRYGIDPDQWRARLADESEEDDDMFCSRGERGPKVRALQVAIKVAIGTMPDDPPGHYEEATARGLAQALGRDGTVDDFGPWIFPQLMAVLGRSGDIQPAPGVYALERGDRGPSVAMYQQALAAELEVRGQAPIKVTGVFNRETEEAVASYQRRSKIDGIVPKVGAIDGITAAQLVRYSEHHTADAA